MADIRFIEGTKVSVYYGPSVLIGVIEFDIKRGEFVFYIEPNTRGFDAGAIKMIFNKLREMNEGEEICQ